MIENRIAELVEKHKQLDQRAKLLNSENEKLVNRTKQLEIELESLKEKYKALQLSKAFDGGNNAESKRVLQEVLREVDQCISLLGAD